MPATTVAGVALLSPKEPTVVQRLFRGTFCSVIQCTHCGSTSATVEPFLDVSLNMPGKDPWDVPVSKKRQGAAAGGGGAARMSKKQEKKLRKREEDRKRREEQLTLLRAQVPEKSRSKGRKAKKESESEHGAKLTRKALDAIPVKPTEQWLRSKKKMALVDWLMQYAPEDLLDQTLKAKGLHRTSPPKKIKKVFSEADLRLAVEDVWSTMQERVRDGELAEKAEENRLDLKEGAIEKAVREVVEDILRQVGDAPAKDMSAEDHGEGDGEAKSPEDDEKENATCGGDDDAVLGKEDAVLGKEDAVLGKEHAVLGKEHVSERPESDEAVSGPVGDEPATEQDSTADPPEAEDWLEEAERLLNESRSAAPHLTHDGGYLHTLDAAIPPAVATESEESLTLEQCLADFTHEEVIPCSEGQGYRCDACLKTMQQVWDARFRGSSQEMGESAPPRPSEAPRREAIKRFVFHQVPPVLVVHMKRFGQSAFGKVHKRSDALVLPEYVSLEQFSTSAAEGDAETKRFRLVGVVVHHGATMTSGHYIAHVRLRGQWACISDASVRQSSVGQAAHDQPYLALYERVPTSDA